MADTDNDSPGDGRDPIDPGSVLLDRSRARMRVPTELFDEVLQLAPTWMGSDADGGARRNRKPDRAQQFAALFDGDRLDPVAEELIGVVNRASLIVAVDVSYRDDSSAATVWATPRMAVASTGLDRAQTELGLIPVNQLPQFLAQLIVLRPAVHVADRPLSIDAHALSRALAESDPDDAVDLLMAEGIDPDAAHVLLRLHQPEARRWRISSSWSTESGPEEAELRGVDAGPDGQWLEATEGPGRIHGQHIFTPLDHGEGMSALREVLPRNWLGVPLGLPAH